MSSMGRKWIRSCTLKSMILDVHTHNQENFETAILSVEASRADLLCYPYISVGIHPWYLTSENFEEQQKWLIQSLALPQVVAIGEVGLDKLALCPWELQLKAFEFIIDLAEEKQKPLIIHNVKSTEVLFGLHKKHKVTQPWIIHGFRGKKELALQCIDKGFYLSFGEKFNADALCAVPMDKLLFETDESTHSIEKIIQRCANEKEIAEHELKKQVVQNIETLFFKQNSCV